MSNLKSKIQIITASLALSLSLAAAAQSAPADFFKEVATESPLTTISEFVHFSDGRGN